MPAFDPDAYLAEKPAQNPSAARAPGFDPDAFLADRTPAGPVTEGGSGFDPDAYLADVSLGAKAAAVAKAAGAGLADAFERTAAGGLGLVKDFAKEYPNATRALLPAASAVEAVTGSPVSVPEAVIAGANWEQGAIRSTRGGLAEVRREAEQAAPVAAAVAGAAGDLAGVVGQAFTGPAAVPLLVANSGEATVDMLPADATEAQRQLARAGGGAAGILDRFIPGSAAASTTARAVAGEALKQGALNVAQGVAQRAVAVEAGANEGVPAGDAPRVAVLDPGAMAVDAGLGVAIPAVSGVVNKGLSALHDRRVTAAFARRYGTTKPVEVRPMAGPEAVTGEGVPEMAPLPIAESSPVAKPAATREYFTPDAFYATGDGEPVPVAALADSPAAREAAAPDPVRAGVLDLESFESAATADEVAALRRAEGAWLGGLKARELDAATGEVAWERLSDESLGRALELPGVRKLAEAEAARRANDFEAEQVRAQLPRETLAEVLGKSVFLPSGADAARVGGADRAWALGAELNAIKRNLGNQGKWMRWVRGERAKSLDHTLEQLHEAGFTQIEDINGVLDALDRTVRGEKIYPVGERAVFADDRAPRGPKPAPLPPATPAQAAELAGIASARGAGEVPPATAGRVVVRDGGERYVYPVEAHPLDNVALVSFGRELGGVVEAARLRPGRRGEFNAGLDRVRVSKELFKNPVEAGRVLAHEIGHLVDKVSSGMKGPVWDRLRLVSEGAREAWPLDPVAGASSWGGKAPDKADYAGWWEAARARTEALVGPRAEYAGGVEAWDRARRKAFADITADTLRAEGWGTGAVVHAELTRWSEAIRPYDRATADPAFVAYRSSPAELYADALSGILAYPESFQAVAPTAWAAWHGHLENSPLVASKYLEAQALLRGAPEARAAKISADFRKGGETGAQKYLDALANEVQPKTLGHWWQQVREGALTTSLLDRQAKLRTRENTLALDDANHADGRTWEWTGRLKEGVFDRLKAAGVDTRDFGESLAMRRIAEGDRSEYANPLGHTRETAARQLAAIEAKYGPEARAAMIEARARVAALWREVQDAAVDAGLYSAAQVEAMRTAAGDAYVPFAVAEHFTGKMGSGIAKQTGTLGDIADPLLALALKGGAVLRDASLNKGRRAGVEGLRVNAPELDFVPVPGVRDAHGRMTYGKPKDGHEFVRVMERGEPVVYQFPKGVAAAFQGMTPANAQVVSGVLSTVFKTFWRKAQIEYNPAFLLWSGPIKDARRAWMNFPTVPGKLGVGAELTANWFARTLGVPRTETGRAALDFVEGRRNALADELVRLGGMSPPHEIFAVQSAVAPEHMQDAAMHALFEKRGLMPTPEGVAAGGFKPAAARVVKAVGRWMSKTGQTSEAVAKLEAYRRLTVEEGWPKEEAARFVRTQIGIPDTRQGGVHAGLVSAFAPYYNVAAQGARADFSQAFKGLPEFTGRGLKGMESVNRVRANYWASFAVGVGVPVTLAVLAKRGDLGEDLRELMGKVSSHDERTGAMLPVGEVMGSDGRKKGVYIKMPYDATEGFYAGLYRNALEAALGDKQPTDALADSGKQVLDLVPGLDPTVDIVRAWGQYITGANPQDNWRQRPIISSGANAARETGRMADKWYALRDMAAWTAAKTGYWSAKPDDGGPDARGIEAAAGYPVLSRLLRVTDAGDLERLRNEDKARDSVSNAWRQSLAEPVRRLASEYQGLRDLSSLINDKLRKGERLNATEMWSARRYRDLAGWNSMHNALAEAAVMAERRGDRARSAWLRGEVERLSRPYYPGAEKAPAAE